MLKKLIKDLGVDSKRVYLTGASMGGIGAWYMAAQYPKMFASALIASGQARNLSASDLYATPVYVTMGTLEGERSARVREFVGELADNACDATFEYLEGLDHGDACEKAFSPERLDWLLSKTK